MQFIENELNKLHLEFNEICIKDDLLPNFTNIYIYYKWCFQLKFYASFIQSFKQLHFGNY